MLGIVVEYGDNPLSMTLNKEEEPLTTLNKLGSLVPMPVKGECLQTIDMNQVSRQNSALYLSDNQQRNASLLAQDNYLEEASKMRNLLQEFIRDHGIPPPTILDVREQIFTGK
ncbi:Callose synthase 9 [Acorus calamus]|uniref:Callose synthase 9 n=1 Tax=Acorus calamus TaxID=4465 RepID=A0AAV9EXY5_ACOCL|nr:Callose synthase 9 [Acorus calamus]